ncbi:MAG: DUF983 domain-containing protein [Bacteroidia bacterium]
MKTPSRIKLKNVIAEKCPKCGKGLVFNKRKHFFQIPDMKNKCEVCGHHFEREPGYFIGAMYVSYGLTVAEGIAVFLLARFFFPGIKELVVIGIIIFVILALSVKNFKLSRMIWMNLFPG